MSPWWPLLTLLFWCPILKSSHCNSFEDGAPVDFIYGCFIFNGVADLPTWQVTRIAFPELATRVKRHALLGVPPCCPTHPSLCTSDKLRELCLPSMHCSPAGSPVKEAALLSFIEWLLQRARRNKMI